MQQYSFQLMIDQTICVTGYDGDDAAVVLPSDSAGTPVTMLGDGVFKGHTEITSVQFPEKLTYIGGFVFDGCTSLHHVELPDTLEDMIQYAFARSGIEEIRLPDKVRSIPSFAFKDCKQLRRVVCGKGLRKIHAWAFQGCDPDLELVCDESVVIDPKAFSENLSS